LSFHHGYQLHHSPKAWEPKLARDVYLSSAIYAYLYLLGPGKNPPPGEFDRRFRIACDLYNLALARGLGSAERTNPVVLLEDGVRDLPPGRVDMDVHDYEFNYEPDKVDKFLAADEFVVRGLSVRNRQSGLGAPLVMVSRRESNQPPTHVPATVFMLVSGDMKSWSAGTLHANLLLHSGYGETTITVGDKKVPLETDVTAPMAVALNQGFLWNLGMAQFFSSHELVKSAVYLTKPYDPNAIPVVLVHGTFSSPVWWAEMINTLCADPVLGRRCQFWYFIYNSGNPTVYSAVKMREALAAKIKELDPEGKSEALKQMVIVGHSQGGLLTKLTATDTGERIWDKITTEAPNIRKLSEKQIEFLQKYVSYEHLPFVKRVVFISTPHRGSYLAGNFVRKLAYKLVKLPGKVVREAAELSGAAKALGITGTVRAPTSLDSMSSNNKFLLALAEIPLAPGIKGHSIIAVQGNGDYHEGKDGLVKYSSAHVDYVESEFIVRSFHSCQDKPQTIEEVRRILLEHLAGLPPGTSSDSGSK
jgi:pimeloyl-ACP methyl ester carboxylesterase